jgi:hypothetical protein
LPPAPGSGRCATRTVAELGWHYEREINEIEQMWDPPEGGGRE